MKNPKSCPNCIDLLNNWQETEQQRRVAERDCLELKEELQRTREEMKEIVISYRLLEKDMLSYKKLEKGQNEFNNYSS